MNCEHCGLSIYNSIHYDTGRFSYHQFLEPPTIDLPPTIEERIGELERRVACLMERIYEL